MAHRAKRNRSPFIKAAVLGTALALALIFYSRVPQTIHRINELMMRMDVEESGGDTLVESRKDSVRAMITGFWAYRGDGGPLRPNVILDDRIELQRNGIIWRVCSETLRLPSGKTMTQTIIEHSYLIPFSGGLGDTGGVQCQVAAIKRARYFGDDTCYDVVTHQVVSGFNNETVEFRESTVWQVGKRGERLVVEGREYDPYGNRDLAVFFPPNAIDIVDDVAVRACRRNETDRALLRGAIADDLGELKGAVRSADSVKTIVDGYYLPECLRPLLVEMAGGGKPAADHFQAAFEIAREGEVKDVKLSGGGLSFNESLSKLITSELMRWRFRPVEGGESTETVRCELKL